MSEAGHEDKQPLALFAHELREPLASILLAAQSIDESPGHEPTCREMGHIVRRQAQFLARLIEDTLQIYGGSLKKLRLHKSWIDLNDVLTNALEATRAHFIERDHQLVVSLPPKGVHVFADAVRVQQIVINLLANAAKYTAPGGRVTFDALVTDGSIVLKIEDNGIGISQNCLPRIFEMFHQAGRSGESGFTGLGIGLALVRALVELHGGCVQAHSDGEGRGAEFSVRMPVSTSPNGSGSIHRQTLPETRSIQQRSEVGFMGDA